MQKEVKISEVLKELFSGYSFRQKVEHDPNGSVSVIQMKDLEDYSTITAFTLTRVVGESISNKYFLKKGDILFICKGSNNYALVYDLDKPKAVASSAFFVLRPDTFKILPAYLAWYINQIPVQKYLKENMAGSYIPNINKSTIEAIEIVLPKIDIQKKVVEMDFLRKREYLLTKVLLDRRKQHIAGALLKFIKE